MRHLNAVEKGALALAVFFAVGGMTILVRPVELTFFPAGDHRVPVHFRSQPVHISVESARVFGCVGLFMGFGLGCLVFYRGPK